jgi:hypothetical protein
VHHHIGTPKAHNHLKSCVGAFVEERAGSGAMLRNFSITFGHCYDESIAVTDEDDPDFMVVAAKYFDKSLVTEHTLAGGSDKLWLGYGECRLSVVLDHNTPNNSFAVLWAQTAGKEGHEMRPLFRRRQRHS